MRIIDFYICRCSHNTTETIFIILAGYIGSNLSNVMKFIKQIKGN